MVTAKEIEVKTMTEKKKEEAYNDFFAFYIGRKLSYYLTIPFLKYNVSPKSISLISILPIIAGFIFFWVGNSKSVFLVGWFCFFLWNLLDGVDGNVARYTSKSSKIGSVYDAMSGYLAMVLTFFSLGVAASHFENGITIFKFVNQDFYTVVGALSGIFMIFPRLIMHKTISTFMDSNIVSDVQDKSNFNIIKVLALNLGSVAGGAQVLMLVAIILNIMNIYTIFYFLFNLLVMIVSIRSIFNKH